MTHRLVRVVHSRRRPSGKPVIDAANLLAELRRAWRLDDWWLWAPSRRYSVLIIRTELKPKAERS